MFVALKASIRPLTCVGSHVRLESSSVREHFGTNAACIRALACVDSPVYRESSLLRKSFATNAACIRALTRMGPHMLS